MRPGGFRQPPFGLRAQARLCYTDCKSHDCARGKGSVGLVDRTFHTDGCCDPKLHYMVDLTTRLEEIRAMVDAGKYFTINRARQYGKTTLLMALAEYLKADYKVISLNLC